VSLAGPAPAPSKSPRASVITCRPSPFGLLVRVRAAFRSALSGSLDRLAERRLPRWAACVSPTTRGVATQGGDCSATFFYALGQTNEQARGRR
jgi:hypothetical protein